MRIHTFPLIIMLLAACSNAPEQKSAEVSNDQVDSIVQEQTPSRTENPEAAIPEAITPKAPAEKTSTAPVAAQTPVPAAPKIVPQPPEESAAPISVAVEPAISPKSGQAIAHEDFDVLLQKHVSNTGKVNYKGLKADKSALEAYCQLLTDNPVQNDWRRAEKMAYWINAYNAFTLKLIVDNYPTKSILNLDGGKTWEVRRIQIGDKKYSLNNIENDILRPTFKDPRIHFAVNCAAKSCPPLWNHAYTAENLESSLEKRTRAFINNSNYNTLSSSNAQVSKIFDWYGADFGKLADYLNKYAETQLNSDAEIGFNNYNWELNN